MWNAVTHSDTDQRIFAAVLLGLAVLAWLALALWGASPYARFLEHGELAHTSLTDVRTLSLMVAGWTLMCVAMMLPTALPLVTIFRALVRRRVDSEELTMLLIVGYLLVWVLFGLAAHVGDWMLHRLTAQRLWLLFNPWPISVAVLAVAGIYQFTPLKYHCLDQCRSSYSFALARWHGRHPRRDALRLGMSHGLYCLGCCWSLMLLMFVVGMSNLGWMLLLSALMAAEKNLPWGRYLARPVGVLLLFCAGGLLLLRLQ